MTLIRAARIDPTWRRRILSTKRALSGCWTVVATPEMQPGTREEDGMETGPWIGPSQGSWGSLVSCIKGVLPLITRCPTTYCRHICGDAGMPAKN